MLSVTLLLSTRYSCFNAPVCTHRSFEDSSGLYGSDYAAMKVAGHELSGAIVYLQCDLEEICIPLVALVDYMGSGLDSQCFH